jgi:hypothetical protein
MKLLLGLVACLALIGCSTIEEPVWSEYYHPQEVLLKPAPPSNPTSVQGKSTFLQSEAQYKEHLEEMDICMTNLLIGGIYAPSSKPLTHERIQSIVAQFGGDHYDYISYPISQSAAYNHIWVELSPQRQKLLNKQGILKYILPPQKQPET